MKTKKLVIVESPAKAKTIHNILGKDFAVFACMGHIVDLPENKLGVDIENGFKPFYTVIPARKKILEKLKEEVSSKDEVYIATDPDREGEAIGWHIKNKLPEDKKYWRVIFQFKRF